MSDSFGVGTLILLIVIVVGLIGLAVAFLRFRQIRGTHSEPLGMPHPSARNGNRLEVLETTVVDTTRRLVLVRCDDVEHLIMVGGAADLVVQSEVGRARGGSGQAVRPSVPLAGPPSPALAPMAPAAGAALAAVSSADSELRTLAPSAAEARQPEVRGRAAETQSEAPTEAPAPPARTGILAPRPGTMRRSGSAQGVAAAVPAGSEPNAANDAAASGPAIPSRDGQGPRRDGASAAPMPVAGSGRRQERGRGGQPAGPQVPGGDRSAANRPQTPPPIEVRGERAPAPPPPPARPQAPPAAASEGGAAGLSRPGAPPVARNAGPPPGAPPRANGPAPSAPNTQQTPTLPPAQVPWPEPVQPAAGGTGPGKGPPAPLPSGPPKPAPRPEATGRPASEAGTTLGDLAERLEEALAREVQGGRRPGPGNPEFDLGGFGLGAEPVNAPRPAPPAPQARAPAPPAPPMGQVPAGAAPPPGPAAVNRLNRPNSNKEPETETPKPLPAAPEAEIRRDPRPGTERPEEAPVISLHARRREPVDPLEDEMARLLGELTGDTNRR